MAACQSIRIHTLTSDHQSGTWRFAVPPPRPGFRCGVPAPPGMRGREGAVPPATPPRPRAPPDVRLRRPPGCEGTGAGWRTDSAICVIPVPKVVPHPSHPARASALSPRRAARTQRSGIRPDVWRVCTACSAHGALRTRPARPRAARPASTTRTGRAGAVPGQSSYEAESPPGACPPRRLTTVSTSPPVSDLAVGAPTRPYDGGRPAPARPGRGGQRATVSRAVATPAGVATRTT